MDELDPEEIVQSEGRPQNLGVVVAKIMSLSPGQRLPIAVFRDQGRTPGIFEVGNIERIAELPAFKANLWAALAAGLPETAKMKTARRYIRSEPSCEHRGKTLRLWISYIKSKAGARRAQ